MFGFEHSCTIAETAEGEETKYHKYQKKTHAVDYKYHKRTHAVAVINLPSLVMYLTQIPYN